MEIEAEHVTAPRSASGEPAMPSMSAGFGDVSEVLLRGELEILGRITTASNATLVCEARLPGTDHATRCVYKPVRGEVPLWDFPDGTLAGREVASFLISEALGWDLIPATVLRDGPYGPGMVQRWVDTTVDHPGRVDAEAFEVEVVASGGLESGAVEAAEPDLVDLCPPELVPDDYLPILRAHDAYGDEVVLVHADDARLRQMAVLDVVLNNADRKGGHILAAADGGVYGVDHGICLHVEDKLRTVLWGWSGRPVPAGMRTDLAELVATLDEPASPLHEQLRGLITPDEIVAASLRAQILAESGVMPSPPHSRPIPWPPF